MGFELDKLLESVNNFGERAFEGFSKERLSHIDNELKRLEIIQGTQLNNFLLHNPEYPIPEEYEGNIKGFWESLSPVYWKINRLRPFLDKYLAKEFNQPNQYTRRRAEFYSSQQYKDLFCKTEYWSEDSFPIPFSSKVEEVLQLGFIDSLELLIRLESDIQLCLIDMKEENVSLGWREEDAYSDKLEVVRLLKTRYSSSSDTHKQILVENIAPPPQAPNKTEQPESEEEKQKLSALLAIYEGMKENKEFDFDAVFEGEKEGTRFMKKLASFLISDKSRTNKKFQIKGRNGARLARFIKKVHDQEKRGVLKTDHKYLEFLRSSINDWSAPEFNLYKKLTN